MTESFKKVVRAAVSLAVVAVVALTGGVVFASHDTNTIHACATTESGALRLVSSASNCRASETAVE